jgi:hypothetical protein
VISEGDFSDVDWSHYLKQDMSDLLVISISYIHCIEKYYNMLNSCSELQPFYKAVVVKCLFGCVKAWFLSDGFACLIVVFRKLAGLFSHSGLRPPLLSTIAFSSSYRSSCGSRYQ